MGEFDMGGSDVDPTTPTRGITGVIREETRRVIDNTMMVDDPAEINGGYCRDLAEQVVARVPEANIYRAWQGMGSRHFFIEHRGRFYDSERPRGVARPSDLPFFRGGRAEGVERVSDTSTDFQ
jgi:hypothetical protein